MKSFCTALFVMAAVVATQAEVDTSKLPPASTKKDITFEKDIKPLFDASCVKCHGENKPKAGLRVDKLDALLKGTKDGKVVEPGNALKSSLLISVSHLDPDTAMPPKPKKRPAGAGGPEGQGGAPANAPKQLTADEVGLVRAWIDQGAK